MKSRSAKLLAAAVILFAAVATIASASGAPRPGVHNGVITVCVEPLTKGNRHTSGDLNMLICAKGARKLSWNVRGPRGPAGAAGAQGAQGPAGPGRIAGREGRHRGCWCDRRSGAEGRHRACWAQRSRRGRNTRHRPGLQPLRRQLGERRLQADASVHPARRWDDPSRSYLRRNVHDHRGRLTAQSRRVPRHTADGWCNGNDQRLRCRGRDGRCVHSERGLSRSMHHNRDARDVLPGSRWTCGDLDGQQRVGISVRRGC